MVVVTEKQQQQISKRCKSICNRTCLLSVVDWRRRAQSVPHIHPHKAYSAFFYFIPIATWLHFFIISLIFFCNSWKWIAKGKHLNFCNFCWVCKWQENYDKHAYIYVYSACGPTKAKKHNVFMNFRLDFSLKYFVYVYNRTLLWYSRNWIWLRDMVLELQYFFAINKVLYGCNDFGFLREWNLKKSNYQTLSVHWPTVEKMVARCMEKYLHIYRSLQKKFDSDHFTCLRIITAFQSVIKNAFKCKLIKLIELNGYILQGSNSKTNWDIVLKFY